MLPIRDLRLAFGLMLLQSVACTLSADYEPPLIDAAPQVDPALVESEPAAPLPSGVPEQPAPAEPMLAPEPPDPGMPVSCSSAAELPGCELSREGSAPVASVECRSELDCSSRNCREGSCVPATCADGLLNQGELNTDCGGPCAPCVQPTCDDGEQNGDETARDCGGGCHACVAGSTCSRAEDCDSGICRDGTCAPASCDDLVRNQNEIDTDCGGVCGPCAAGQGCALDSDCQSSACQDGACCGGKELDCTRCARRLAASISCASNGASVEVSSACNGFLQCLADHPLSCSRRLAPGCTDAGSACDVVNYGGNGSAGITLADGILGTAQCNF